MQKEQGGGGPAIINKDEISGKYMAHEHRPDTHVDSRDKRITTKISGNEGEGGENHNTNQQTTNDRKRKKAKITGEVKLARTQKKRKEREIDRLRGEQVPQSDRARTTGNDKITEKRIKLRGEVTKI